MDPCEPPYYMLSCRKAALCSWRSCPPSLPARRDYVGDGKMPNSEMMKSTHRYGWKLVCGWLPPVEPMEVAAICWLGFSFIYRKPVVVLAKTLFCGAVDVPVADDPRNGWPCAGICETVSVTCSTPPVSARINPLPW